MANTEVTPQDVIDANVLDEDTSTGPISYYIPLATSYVNTELDNKYDEDEHGCVVEYRTAICIYTYYLIIAKTNTFSLSGLGKLNEGEVDVLYNSSTEVRAKKKEMLAEVQGYLNTIRLAMEDEGEDLEDIEGVSRISGLTIISTGGNDNYKTYYGESLKNNDDNLRG